MNLLFFFDKKPQPVNKLCYLPTRIFQDLEAYLLPRELDLDAVKNDRS